MKDLEKLVMAGGISSVLLGLPMKNIQAIILLALSYMFFIYCPFILIINKIRIGLAEKFFLLNLAGLSYSMVYVLLDVFFKVPLTKLLFLITTLIVYVLSYYISKNIKKS